MLTKEQLKVKLVALGCFKANKYLDEYVQLCITKLQMAKAKFKTNAHHIIPRKYYKVNNLPLDNSSQNLVNLSYYDHIIAHYYLVLCSVQTYLQYSNAVAFVMLTNNKFLTVDEIKKIKNLDRYLEVYKNYESKPKSAEHKAALSKARDLHSTTAGKKSIYNPTLNKVKFVDTDELLEYLSVGWIVGGKPLTAEAKQKISKSNSKSLQGKTHAPIATDKSHSGLIGAKIECIETGMIFENIQQAKEWLFEATGVSGGQIKNCCAGARIATGGYHWRYYKE